MHNDTVDDFLKLDQWLTEKIDPLVNHGMLVRANANEMEDQYHQWEQDQGLSPKESDTFEIFLAVPSQ